MSRHSLAAAAGLLVALAASGAAFSACGSDETAAGFAPVTRDVAADAGGKDADAAPVDLRDAWPTVDPMDDSGAATEAGPSFDDPDASPVMAPDAAPPPSCAGKTGAAGDSTITIAWGGLARTALVHVPPSLEGTTAAPLVLNFHGFTSDGLQESVLSRMNAAADAHQFIAVYPYGVAASWNAGKCCGDAWTNSVDDVGFVGALLDELSVRYCVDTARTYATGMSNGGFLSHLLGCTMSDRFAAIAPVAGVLGIDPASCTPKRPMPVLHFHGTQDPLVPYLGGNPVVNIGLAGTLDFPSVHSSIDAWRAIDGCTGAGENVFLKGDASCVRYGGCNGGAEVVLCTITGGGHTWPGGVDIPPLGKTSHDISATDTMISFFAAHPMP